MNLRCFFGFLAVSLLHSFNNPAVAEFVCAAEISYKWIRAPEGAAGASTPQPGSAATGTPGAFSGEASTVRYASVERAGVDEAAAKSRLEAETNRLKVKASEACRREHEAFGSCVATKLASKASLLGSLDFSARKEVQRALSEECQAQAGTCIGVATTDPQCREVVTAQPTAAPGAEKKGDGKKK